MIVMKKSVATKLSWRISIVIIVALMLLLAGVFISLNKEVRQKGEEYTKAIVGIFGDLITYESDISDRPIDLSFNDRISFFGDYFCSWYRVDYIYSIIPNFEDGTITYLSVSKNKDKFDDNPDDHMVGVTVDHIMTENEIRAWNDSTFFAIEESDRFNHGTDVMLRVSDKYGNKVLVGADIAMNELQGDVLKGFSVVAAFIFIIVALLAIFLHFLISNMVSKPAKVISQNMSDYISGGERTPLKLDVGHDDEFSMISDAFNNMTSEIDKYIQNIATMERNQERQQTEIDIAAKIQEGFLSVGSASLNDCSIKAVMKPAKEVGGDLYDYLKIDKSHTMVVVADVSGKGISSAFLMAVVLTHFHQFANMGYTPAQILKSVNVSFSAKNPQLMFVTAFVGIYDSDRGIFTYSNAGHNPPYLVNIEPVLLDESNSTPLGLFIDEEYTDVEIKVENNSSIFLYTDGVTEAVNGFGEFYGTDRLEKVLRETALLPKKHFVEAVEESLKEFVGNTIQNDDITMLNLSIRNKPSLELNYDIKEFGAIRDYLFASNLPKHLILDLCVAAEEIFVNICNYAFDGPAPKGEKILFYFEYSDIMVMQFSDGGKQFDPRIDLPEAEDYDIDNAVGGLGRLIAFTVADSVDYDYIDGRNILTLKKSVKQ